MKSIVHQNIVQLCLLLPVLWLSSIAVNAQTVIQGTVTSADDGTPLAGVTIQIVDQGTGEVTDFDGSYSLTVNSLPVKLAFSYIGYATTQIDVAQAGTYNVALETDNLTFDEVLVVGYGEQSRSTLTTSVTKLDEKVIENTVFSNAASSMQGTVSGVRVQTLSGQPGEAPRVIVRGGTSINNPNGAQPLYIVDGVIRQDLEGINAADIESLQVLKDAASTAIYGARGSNGVVIVTLKKGKAGKTVVNYRYSHGFSQLRERYDVLNARDYIYYNRLGLAATGVKQPQRLTRLNGAFGEGIGNDLTNTTAYTTQYLTDENRYKLDEGWESMPDPLDPSKTIIFQGTDWQDVLYRTGVTRDHYLSVSGGESKATFNLGVGYTDVDGIAINTNYSRWSANLNGRLTIRPNLFAFGGLNYSRESDNKVYSENQLFERSIATPPTAKYTYEDGTLAPGVSRSLGNPAYHLSRLTGGNSDNMITLTGGFSWEPISGLVFEPTASIFYMANDGSSFQKSYYNTPTQLIDSRDASATFNKYDQQQLDATLTYTKSIDNLHNFQGKLGFSYFNRISSNISATGRGAATDLIPTLNASAEPINVSSFSTQQLIIGYFGRFTYDYDQRYLFALNARYDGASNLGDENKWGFFPGISAGWNIHNEDFWNEPLSLSSLKLRASYGINGNLGNLSDFTAQGQYSVGSTYDGVAAVEYTGIANQALKWEQSKTFDVGFDAGFVKDRFTILFDYYHRITDNLITTLALPKSTGFTSILTNLGSLENKGLEIEVGAGIIRKNDFSWDLSFNASKNTNEIVELPENDNENNRIG
ncbi:MAG: SusC/RagA family TonB-linked outer membrane protein, partial [Saprospiraceae bacterium]|nr:SusC/RagA family TonB-linked outer membrane protein [Saprospiraceae bacterium]